MNKYDTVTAIVGAKKSPTKKIGTAFAPANIALCKYWGKRNNILNLPVTSSLSISLGDKGTNTQVEVIASDQDEFLLNGIKLQHEDEFCQRLTSFLDLFRLQGTAFRVVTKSNIPVAAGLASSASGFAAIVKALDDLFAWQLPDSLLSILARLGSGSASRSLWHGFVEWVAGTRDDGMDSCGCPLPVMWLDFRVGLLVLLAEKKHISSRVAMNTTVQTSPFYQLWPARIQFAMQEIKSAIFEQDFTRLGMISEHNALEMHALMMTATPAIIYSSAETLQMIKTVHNARQDGIDVYFTQDAGPNLKLLFLAKDQLIIQELFPNIEVIAPISNDTLKGGGQDNKPKADKQLKKAVKESGYA